MPDLFDFADATQATLAPPSPLLASLALAEKERLGFSFTPLPRVGSASPLSARSPNLGQTQLPATPKAATPKAATPAPFASPDGDARPATRRGTSPFAGAPASVDVVGAPSLKLFFEGGATQIELRRESRYTPFLGEGDLAGLQAMHREVFEMLRALSRGPYSARDLKKMGHPYGFDTAQGGARSRRRLSRSFGGRSIGHATGVRGSVPSKTVVNSPSGNFAAAWEMDFKIHERGVSLIWRNSATSDKGFPYSAALLMGTKKMQSHGPFTYAPLSRLAQIDTEWRRVARAGWGRAQMDELLGATLGD